MEALVRYGMHFKCAGLEPRCKCLACRAGMPELHAQFLEQRSIYTIHGNALMESHTHRPHR
jgi:hypothetical protein